MHPSSHSIRPSQKTARPLRLSAQSLIFLVALQVAACASPPARPLVLEIENTLGRPIREIARKDCAEPESSFVAIEDSGLPSGASRGFVMPSTCIDLVARDARGRIVGKQYGLRMQRRARWVLRR